MKIASKSRMYTDDARVHRGNPTVVRQRCAQRSDSENEHSVLTAMVLIVM